MCEETMKKKGKIMKLGIILGSIFLICALSTGAFLPEILSQEKTSSVSRLIAPAFAQEIEASFLKDEAGITAYTNTGQKIDLTKVKNIFKTVDKETDTYIIGTIIDMQAFVHEDGRIAVYYLKDEPIGKIVDPEDYGEKIISTKLERELARICDAAEVGLPYVKHYNFKYPNANRLRIITESVTNVKGYDSNTFDMKIPCDFTVYERSWLHYQYWEYEPESYMIYNLKSELEIDDDTINSMPQHTATRYGQITPSHLLPDIFHTVGLYVSNYHPSGFRWIGDDKGFIAIIIIYQEPAISSQSSRIIQRDADSMVTLDLEPFSPSTQQTPTPTPIQIQTPVVSQIPSEYPTPTLKPGELYVHLYGHKTKVIVGEEVILYLSVVNPITSPSTLKVQLTLQVPSGWSITSGEFSPPVGGFQTAVYDIEQGLDPKTIGIHMLANQPFEGVITGYTDYYFIEEPETKYHKEVNEPVTAKQTEPSPSAPSLPSVPSNGGMSPEVKSIISALIVATIGGVFARAIWNSIKKRGRSD